MNRSEPQLTDIVGIAKRTADKLALEGVKTVEQLRDLSEEEMDQLDVKLGLRGQPRHGHWREQAADLLRDETSNDAPVVHDDTIAKLNSQLAMLKQELKARGEGTTSAGGNSNRRRRLNRNQDFGDVFGTHLQGESSTGAAFMQIRDGKEIFFNHLGIEILPNETAGTVDDSDVEPEHRPKELSDFHPINYLDSKADYDFEFVRKAVKSRFGRDVKTVRHAKAMLHEQLRQNH